MRRVRISRFCWRRASRRLGLGLGLELGAGGVEVTDCSYEGGWLSGSGSGVSIVVVVVVALVLCW